MQFILLLHAHLKALGARSFFLKSNSPTLVETIILLVHANMTDAEQWLERQMPHQKKRNTQYSNQQIEAMQTR